MDVRSLYAAQQYSALKPALETSELDGMADQGPSLRENVNQAVTDFSELLKTSEELAETGFLGESDPHALVEALSKSELAVETVVAIRNKVVEAYQEILRMPV